MKRLIALLVVVLPLVLVAIVGIVLYQGFQARRHVENVATAVSSLQTHTTNGQVDLARADAEVVRREAALAREKTSGVVWKTCAEFPWGGQNLKAVSQASATFEELSATGLPAAIEAAASAKSIRQSPALLRDPSTVNGLRTQLGTVRGSIDTAQASIDGIDRNYLWGPMSTALDRISQQINNLRSTEQKYTALIGTA